MKTMDHSLGWVAQCKQSVEALQADIKQATSHRAKCCQVLAAALAAQLALEHAVHREGLTSHQSQALQQLCASTFAGIELAQLCIQVTGVMRLLSQDTLSWKHSAEMHRTVWRLARLMLSQDDCFSV